MAHNVEPMDIDNIESDFDNKENSIHHSNVYPRTPCTEKGYEELDVSELNMKLRYSITPAASPMSKSYTANCADNRTLELGDDTLNANLTRSLNSTIAKSDIMNKSVKTLPLQTITTEPFGDSNRNTSVLRPLDTTTIIDNNVTVTITQTNDIDENLSLPSSSSSVAQTPEATTPTKDISRTDGGSPIMRGLKSVLNMFRSSQSPIPPADNTEIATNQVLSPADISTCTPDNSQAGLTVLASTPLASHKHKDSSLSKRSSPHKESIVFNEDLEKELLWKDETTILFSQEKIPIHKLFFQQSPNIQKTAADKEPNNDNLNSTVEYMDISYNDSFVKNKTITDLQTEGLNESDAEFLDCETTFTNDKSQTAAVEENDHVSNEILPKVISADNVQLQFEGSFKEDLTQFDATKTLPHENNDNQPIESLPELKQVEVPVKTNILGINDKLEITDNEQIDIKVISTTISQGNIKTTLKESNDGGNSTMELSDSKLVRDNDQTFSLQENVIHKTFVQQSDQLPVTPDVCDTTYSTKADDETFITETVTENFNTNTSKVEGTTFVKNIESVLMSSENATFVKEFETIPEIPTTVSTEVENITFVQDTCDKEIVLNVEDVTFVREIKTAPDFSEVPTTVNTKVENITFVHETGNEEIALNVEDATFVKITEVVPDDINKTCTGSIEYSAFAKDIENELAIEATTSTPSTATEIHDSPANIPLPDEDDIENDKSVGTSMLVEENTVPVDLVNANNAADTKLKNENIKEMQMNIEKSIDTNNKINDPIENKASIIPISTVTGPIVLSDVYTNEVTVNEINGKCDDAIETNKILRQNLTMDINESIINDRQMVVDVQETTFNLENNFDISMTQDFNMENVPKGTIPAETEITDMNIARLTPTSDAVENGINNVDIPITKLETVSETKLDEELIVNYTTPTLKDKIDNQLIDKTEVAKSMESQGVILNTIALATEVPQIDMPAIEPLAIDSINSGTNGEVINQTNVNKDCTQVLSSLDNICDTLPKSTNITKNEVDLLPEIKDETIGSKDKRENDLSSTENHETESGTVDILEEIVLSENNSPYVSVAERIDSIPTQSANFEDVENPFATKARVVLTPPASPKIVSKGYNFNFDEIDDPFATKTKIRLSPPPETSPKEMVNTTFDGKEDPPKKDVNKNRRKSQPERKRPVMPKKKLNSTFSGPVKTTTAQDIKKSINNIDSSSNVKSACNDTGSLPNSANQNEGMKSSSLETDCNTKVDFDSIPKKTLELSTEETFNKDIGKELKSLDDRDIDTAAEVATQKENNATVECMNAAVSEAKITSSSEQSAYYSAGASSSESAASKNVFNIPKIDDVNFNPFVTKSKMRQSPPPGLVEDRVIEAVSTESDTTNIESNEVNLESKISTINDKECANISNTTCSSKASDEKDITVCEVHTEDEDTVEGPFLEADDNDKMSDFDGEDVDMMQFSELPPQHNEENMENGEMFIDAEAFEFLLNQNKSNIVSDSGKESLFLKFDPLFAKRVSTDGVLAALNKVQKRQSTPKKMATAVQMDATFEKVTAGPSTLNETHEIETNVTAEESTEDLNVTVSKPMMVVTPAVNPVVTPRNKTTTPTSLNRRSITFTSPAIAVIDRLLSLSANNSLVGQGHDTTVTVSREQNEADLALTQLRELLAEKEINVYSLRSESKELKDRLSSLESQMRSLESESQERLRKINEMNEKLTEKTKLNKSMAAVVEEYERTIASLIAETEQDKKRNNEERVRLIKERDEQTAHLASMEVSFSDLHSKYEKSKQIILTCKANEDAYKKSIKEFEENLSKMQSNYELLKQHATSKLNHANQELEKMNRAHESEVLKMNAMIKRKDLHITSLEETLAQKTKANEELTAICDELINKVG